MLRDNTSRSGNSRRVLDAAVLLVEDNRLNQRMIEGTLRHYGFSNVTCVNDGKSAIAHFAEQLPDLILTDLLMPGMDGFALCREIRHTPQWKDIPIIALTALESEESRLSILSLGANDLLRKPITEQELVARCRLQLEKRHIVKDLQDYRFRMEEDLSHARDMQNLLMPDAAVIKQTEQQFNLSIRSIFAPSSTIGGDYWGVRSLTEPHKLALYIGDFTGHGVTAAINVFRLSMLMDKLSPAILSEPAKCLQHLNHQLHSILPIHLFSTMFYGVLDIQADTLTYCVAGCPPPLLLPQTENHRLLEGRGLPLAAVSESTYTEQVIAFLPGDSLLLYSDALIETANEDGQHLSIDAIGEELDNLTANRRHAETLIGHVLQHFSPHSANGLEDDLTINIYSRNA